MNKIVFTRKFEKSYKALDSVTQGRARKALATFADTPRNNGLNFEQVSGTNNFWSIRADRGTRIILESIEPHEFKVIDVGNHDYIYKKYG